MDEEFADGGPSHAEFADAGAEPEVTRRVILLESKEECVPSAGALAADAGMQPSAGMNPFAAPFAFQVTPSNAGEHFFTPSHAGGPSPGAPRCFSKPACADSFSEPACTDIRLGNSTAVRNVRYVGTNPIGESPDQDATRGFGAWTGCSYHDEGTSSGEESEAEEERADAFHSPGDDSGGSHEEGSRPGLPPGGTPNILRRHLTSIKDEEDGRRNIEKTGFSETGITKYDSSGADCLDLTEPSGPSSPEDRASESTDSTCQAEGKVEQKPYRDCGQADLESKSKLRAWQDSPSPKKPARGKAKKEDRQDASLNDNSTHPARKVQLKGEEWEPPSEMAFAIDTPVTSPEKAREWRKAEGGDDTWQHDRYGDAGVQDEGVDGAWKHDRYGDAGAQDFASSSTKGKGANKASRWGDKDGWSTGYDASKADSKHNGSWQQSYDAPQDKASKADSKGNGSWQQSYDAPQDKVQSSPGEKTGLLKNVRSGCCLHVTAKQVANGDPVVHHTSQSEGSQWVVEPLGTGSTVLLRSRRSGFFLHVGAKQASSGDPVTHRDSRKEGSQWDVEMVEGSTTRVLLRNIRSGFYLHVSAQQAASGDPVTHRSSVTEGSQWDLVSPEQADAPAEDQWSGKQGREGRRSRQQRDPQESSWGQGQNWNGAKGGDSWQATATGEGGSWQSTGAGGGDSWQAKAAEGDAAWSAKAPGEEADRWKKGKAPSEGRKDWKREPREPCPW